LRDVSAVKGKRGNLVGRAITIELGDAGADTVGADHAERIPDL
jgi:hypothetical protein